MVSLGTVKDDVATSMTPLVAAGFAGSKSMLPLIPAALPEIGSKRESKWKEMALTPFGSLKSKVVAPKAIEVVAMSNARNGSFMSELKGYEDFLKGMKVTPRSTKPRTSPPPSTSMPGT